MRGSNPRLLAHKTNTLPTELMELLDHLKSNKKKKGRARVEPATYRAATDCSTTELTPQYDCVKSLRELNPGLKLEVNVNDKPLAHLM